MTPVPGRFEEEKNLLLLPGFEPGTVHPLVYTPATRESLRHEAPHGRRTLTRHGSRCTAGAAAPGCSTPLQAHAHFPSNYKNIPGLQRPALQFTDLGRESERFPRAKTETLK